MLLAGIALCVLGAKRLLDADVLVGNQSQIKLGGWTNFILYTDFVLKALFVFLGSWLLLKIK